MLCVVFYDVTNVCVVFFLEHGGGGCNVQFVRERLLFVFNVFFIVFRIFALCLLPLGYVAFDFISRSIHFDLLLHKAFSCPHRSLYPCVSRTSNTYGFSAEKVKNYIKLTFF